MSDCKFTAVGMNCVLPEGHPSDPVLGGHHLMRPVPGCKHTTAHYTWEACVSFKADAEIPLTKERADEIVKQCQLMSTCGPWCDYLDKVMTPSEKAQINARWDTMPGHTCFVDALNSFRRGS